MKRNKVSATDLFFYHLLETQLMYKRRLYIRSLTLAKIQSDFSVTENAIKQSRNDVIDAFVAYRRNGDFHENLKLHIALVMRQKQTNRFSH